ncbi:MAG TPA: ferric reductase-like transmembrane domain-containing protein [Amycolatopsis sp.]
MPMLLLGATAVAHSPYDAGVRQVAQLSSRLAYLFSCLTVVWGVFTATGWVGRLSGRPAVRGAHLVLAVFTIAFGVLHAAAFLLLTDADEQFGPLLLTVPMAGGGTLRWAAGIVGLELMIAIAVTAGLRNRVAGYRKWLRFHQLGYVAVGLVVAHSWLGAAANGHLDVLWLAGLTVLAPAVLACVLRFVPSRLLASAGLIGG